MKRISLMFSLFFLLAGCKKATEQYSNLHQIEIEKHQAELNKQYADSIASPLKTEDLATFEALEFFPIDENFKVEAILELTPNDLVFEMQTTTDRKPLYKRYGVATFKLNGKEFKLNVYQNQELILDFEYRNYLFLPFNDQTNGQDTYKGGRYIDIEIPENNLLIIDFNKAYNPYCAYNSKYSCPVVPSENNLDIEIKAGVKAFKNH